MTVDSDMRDARERVATFVECAGSASGWATMALEGSVAYDVDGTTPAPFLSDLRALLAAAQPREPLDREVLIEEAMQATCDPGRFTPRGADSEGTPYGEAPGEWQRRALRIALAPLLSEGGEGRG